MPVLIKGFPPHLAVTGASSAHQHFLAILEQVCRTGPLQGIDPLSLNLAVTLGPADMACMQQTADVPDLKDCRPQP